MRQLWRQVDGLLRNREALSGEEALQKLNPWQLLMASIVLGAMYGALMGIYGIFSRTQPEYRQVLADAWKVPALFVLTLLICFPSLYVFSTLLGSRLSFGATLTLLFGIVTVTVTVLTSFGPIVAFFALSTDNYAFMKLLNVGFFAVAGFLGVGALLRALQVLLQSKSLPTSIAESASGPPPLINQLNERVESNRRVKRVFRIWIFIYALVGCQMAWVLRPFLGAPNSPFTWFRARQANFFIDVLHTIGNFFS
ncbi:MAG TPA: hypothetical protein VLZ30_03090 [Verrucomicrobiae bacterium]|nr:hypothetical protein [Verrucomicrobiae bacterium]